MKWVRKLIQLKNSTFPIFIYLLFLFVSSFVTWMVSLFSSLLHLFGEMQSSTGARYVVARGARRHWRRWLFSSQSPQRPYRDPMEAHVGFDDPKSSLTWGCGMHATLIFPPNSQFWKRKKSWVLYLPVQVEATLRRREDSCYDLQGMLNRAGPCGAGLQPQVPVSSFHFGISSCWQHWKGDPFWASKCIQMTDRAAERNVKVLLSEIILLFQLASHIKSFNRRPSLPGCNADCRRHFAPCLVVAHSINETIDFFLTGLKCSHVWLHVYVTLWVGNGPIFEWMGNKIQLQTYSSSLEEQIYCLQWKAVSNYLAILILAYIAPISWRKWAVVIKGS